jgi:hypothetical protein
MIHCLNKIGSQQEISMTKAISYLLNLLDHKIDHDFIYIPWHSLSAWVNEQEKNQNVQNDNDNDTNVNYEIFTVDKNSSNQQFIIHNFRIDYQRYLLILIFYVRMNFLIRQTKSTSIVIDLIMNTLNTTSIAFRIQ